MGRSLIALLLVLLAVSGASAQDPEQLPIVDSRSQAGRRDDHFRRDVPPRATRSVVPSDRPRDPVGVVVQFVQQGEFDEIPVDEQTLALMVRRQIEHGLVESGMVVQIIPDSKVARFPDSGFNGRRRGRTIEESLGGSRGRDEEQPIRQPELRARRLIFVQVTLERSASRRRSGVVTPFGEVGGGQDRGGLKVTMSADLRDAVTQTIIGTYRTVFVDAGQITESDLRIDATALVQRITGKGTFFSNLFRSSARTSGRTESGARGNVLTRTVALLQKAGNQLIPRLTLAAPDALAGVEAAGRPEQGTVPVTTLRPDDDDACMVHLRLRPGATAPQVGKILLIPLLSEGRQVVREGTVTRAAAGWLKVRFVRPLVEGTVLDLREEVMLLGKEEG